MLLEVQEVIFGIRTVRIEEIDDMKVKCDLCRERDGDAVKTENIYLVEVNGKQKLVCASCKAKVITDRRKNYEKLAGL